MFTMWPLVAHDRNHSINIMAKWHAHDCYSHGHCTYRDRMLSLACMCVCVCMRLLYLLTFHHLRNIQTQINNFKWSFWQLLSPHSPPAILYLRSLEKQKFLKHSGWSSHTHALKNWGNALVVVSFPQPKYCYKFTVLTPMQSITYSPLYSQNSPTCTHTFPFFNTRLRDTERLLNMQQSIRYQHS